MQCNADIEKNVGIHYKSSSSNPDIGKVTNFHWLVKLFQLKLGNTFQSRIETCTAASERYICSTHRVSVLTTYTKRQLSRFGDLKHAGIASKGLKVNSSQCGWKSKQQQ